MKATRCAESAICDRCREWSRLEWCTTKAFNRWNKREYFVARKSYARRSSRTVRCKSCRRTLPCVWRGKNCFSRRIRPFPGAREYELCFLADCHQSFLVYRLSNFLYRPKKRPNTTSCRFSSTRKPLALYVSLSYALEPRFLIEYRAHLRLKKRNYSNLRTRSNFFLPHSLAAVHLVVMNSENFRFSRHLDSRLYQARVRVPT